MSTGEPPPKPKTTPPSKPEKLPPPGSDATVDLDLSEEDLAKLREDLATWKEQVEKD